MMSKFPHCFNEVLNDFKWTGAPGEAEVFGSLWSQDRKLGSLMSSMTLGSTLDLEEEGTTGAVDDAEIGV